MDVMEHDSDSEPSEIMEHEGYTYEKKWTGNTCDGNGSDWMLWKCVEHGCAGQIATAAVRTKRWRRKRFAVQRDVARNRLTAFVPRRPHNHEPSTAHGNYTSVQIEKATAIVKPRSTSTSPTEALDAPSCKELKTIDFHRSETESSLSTADIENINSNNLDNVSKSMETVEPTVNTFDDSMKMSNINDTMELQAVKPVSLNDRQTNSEKRSLKDIV